jgi:hypothetical protein
MTDAHVLHRRADFRTYQPRLGRRIDRQEVAVGLTAEDEAAGGRRRPAPLTDSVGRLVLPDDLIRIAADCGKGAAHRRADRRRLGAAVEAFSEQVLGIEPRKRTGSDRPWNIKAAGFGVVRHRRPVGATDPRRLDQHRLFPERLEDAAGLFIAALCHGFGTLRHDGVADREGLRLRSLLPRLLRHRALLDTDQRLAIGAVEDVDPPRPSRLGDALAGLAVNHRVE